MCVYVCVPDPSPPTPAAKLLRKGRVDFQGPGCLLSCYTIFCSWALQLKVWFQEIAAISSYGSLLNTQNLRPNPDPLNQSMPFLKTPCDSCACEELVYGLLFPICSKMAYHPVFLFHPVRWGKVEAEGMQICFKGMSWNLPPSLSLRSHHSSLSYSHTY